MPQTPTTPGSAPPHEVTPAPSRVLFIGGVGRSGSTLLTRALGSLPGYVAVGETFFIWDQGVSKDRVCSCWRPFSECPFWSAVGDAAFGGWQNVDGEAVRQVRRRILRTRHTPYLAAPRRPESYERDLRAYAEMADRLYAGISVVTDGAVIVDSSKYPAAGYLLRHLDGDGRLVHLVRDSRGVAFSWAKSLQRVEDGRAFPQAKLSRTAAEWISYNALFAGLQRLGVPRLLVRYDDLVADPASMLRRVAEFAGRPVDATELGFVSHEWIDLDPVHIAAGNPMRFENGRRPIALDDAWRQGMPTSQRNLVTAMTMPGLLAYGFVGRNRASGEESR
jgi:hypothetical protein